MSKYTIRMKEIMENYYFLNNQERAIFETSDLTENDEWENTFKNKYQDYISPFDKPVPTVDEIIENSWRNLFNFSYPKLPDYPEGQLEKKIIKHYYMREIGFETIERFKLGLNETLNLVMPYYIDLYKSIKLNDENPLVNYEMNDNSTRVTTTEGTSNGNSTSTNNSTVENSGNTTNTSNANNKQIFEDTPSNALSPDTNYATNITKNSGDSTETGTSKSNSKTNGSETNTNTVTDNSTANDSYNRHATGLMNYSKQDMISRYRDNIINIDEIIIMELRDLFMGIY